MVSFSRTRVPCDVLKAPEFSQTWPLLPFKALDSRDKSLRAVAMDTTFSLQWIYVQS